MFKIFVFFVSLSYFFNAFSQEKEVVSDKQISKEFSKIGVVDMRKILNESTAYQGVVEQFEDIRRKHRNKITKKEDALKDAENDLFKQKNIISREAYAEKLKELTAKVSALKNEKNNSIKNYEISFERATNKIQSSLVDVLSKIANDQKLDMVLSKDQVLLVGRDIDITNDSIEKLNEVLPEIKFELVK